MPCAVILTALPVEYLAVRKHLANPKEVVHPNGTVYERGDFADDWRVGLVEIGAGNAGAALEAERAIEYFKPDVILFVGVAGGIKDVELGDVVASTKIYGYESGKVEQVFKPRPEIGLSAYSLEQRARTEAKKTDWWQRLDGSTLTPSVLVAPIAAGEKVVASTESEVFKFLQSTYGDAVAVEMEGFGFLEAARANHQVSAMVIRGISDLISGKSKVDKAGYQKIAASHASAFAFEILARFQLSEKPDDKVTKQQSIKTTVVSGQEIEIFFSYAHKDEALRDKLANHLKTLQRQKIIKQWHDRQIGAGNEWAGEIDQHLNSSHIILLLLSSDFIASDYCCDTEVARAMERHQRKEAKVIPIILRSVDLDGMPFKKLQTLPRNQVPVTSWLNEDEAFTDIAKEIRNTIKELTANP
jgi:nucleoside phosphorylase